VILGRYQERWNLHLKLLPVLLGAVQKATGNKPPGALPARGLFHSCSLWTISSLGLEDIDLSFFSFFFFILATKRAIGPLLNRKILIFIFGVKCIYQLLSTNVFLFSSLLASRIDEKIFSVSANIRFLELPDAKYCSEMDG
jgi:hypothetical protein